jgi:hypothetical protein
MALWPQHHDAGAYHYEPQWRDKPARPDTATERVTAYLDIITLALNAADHNPDRLCDLINSMGTAPPNARALLRDHLTTFPNDDQAVRLLLLLALPHGRRRQRIAGGRSAHGRSSGKTYCPHFTAFAFLA